MARARRVGFYDPGTAWKAILDGETCRESALPCNPGGGLKARGHPFGASGVAQIIELYWCFRDQRTIASSVMRKPDARSTSQLSGTTPCVLSWRNNDYLAESRRVPVCKLRSSVVLYEAGLSGMHIGHSRGIEIGTGVLQSTTTVYITPDGVRLSNRFALARFEAVSVIAQISDCSDELAVGDQLQFPGEYHSARVIQTESLVHDSISCNCGGYISSIL